MQHCCCISPPVGRRRISPDSPTACPAPLHPPSPRCAALLHGLQPAVLHRSSMQGGSRGKLHSRCTRLSSCLLVSPLTRRHGCVARTAQGCAIAHSQTLPQQLCELVPGHELPTSVKHAMPAWCPGRLGLSRGLGLTCVQGGMHAWGVSPSPSHAPPSTPHNTGAGPDQCRRPAGHHRAPAVLSGPRGLQGG